MEGDVSVKRLFSLMLTFIMVLSLVMTVPAYAANVDMTISQNAETGHIEIRAVTDGSPGIEYKVVAYKGSTIYYEGTATADEDGNVKHDFFVKEGTGRISGLTIGIKSSEMSRTVTQKITYAGLPEAAESVILFDAEDGNVMYNGGELDLRAYFYNNTDSTAEYKLVFSDASGWSKEYSFNIDSKVRTLRHLILNSPKKLGANDLTYEVFKNGTSVQSGSIRVAVIEKFNDNYRYEDASMGVHSRIVDTLTAEKDNKKELDMLHKAGVSKVRLGQTLHWSSVEKEKGVYDVGSNTEAFISSIKDNKMTILFGALGLNKLYDESSGYPRTKEQIDAFCEYVKEVCSSVSEIEVAEIWNEPDSVQFWGNTDAYAVEYASLVKAVAMAIREVRPDIKIIAGAVSSSSGATSNNWLYNLMEQEVKPYVDGFSYHPYCNQKDIDWALSGWWQTSFVEPIKEKGGWLDYYLSELGWATGTQITYYNGIQ